MVLLLGSIWNSSKALLGVMMVRFAEIESGYSLSRKSQRL